MNLVINASEAIGEKEGVIQVATSCVTVGRDSLVNMMSHMPPGEYVQLEVSDNGRGMTDEVRAKILRSVTSAPNSRVVAWGWPLYKE